MTSKDREGQKSGERVCRVEEIPPGGRKIVEINGVSIGIFNVKGDFYALANVCPHQLASLCSGEITGVVESHKVGEFDWKREGEIIRCPRHKWAFDIKTGESIFNPHKIKTRTFDVEVENVTSDVEEQIEEYGTPLAGDEPPVETFDTDIEGDYVVVYV